MAAVRMLLSALARISSSQAGSPALMRAVITGSQLSTGFQTSTAAALAHSFSTSSVLPDSLKSLLAKEIKYEKSEYSKPDIIAKGPPAPFTLEEAPGDTAVTLKREYKGEQISVDASVNMQGFASVGEGQEGEDGEEEAEGADAVFNVTVSKAGQSLVFLCVSDGTTLHIRHVSLEPEEGLDSDAPYRGPDFQDLDTDLQDGFHRFLEQRSINRHLGQYLRFLLCDREQHEYVRWLQGVHKFLTTK